MGTPRRGHLHLHRRESRNLGCGVHINGDNPAIIQVRATYTDLGATITGPQADLNLGTTSYVNGSEMSPAQIDTSTAATDTVVYVATDLWGTQRLRPEPSSWRPHLIWQNHLLGQLPPARSSSRQQPRCPK